MSDSTPELSIGQVAERTGLSVHALRFYEHEGLFVGPVRRGPNGHRLYSEWDVGWLEVCIRFRSSGMPLTAIRRYVDLVRQGSGNEEDRLTILRRHQEQVTAQLGELAECLDLINYKIRVYEEHLAHGTAGSVWSVPAPSENETSTRR